MSTQITEQIIGCTRLQIGIAKKCNIQISNYMYHEFVTEYDAIIVTARMLDYTTKISKHGLDIKIYFENREKMQFFMLTFHRMNHGEIKEITVENCQDNRSVQYTCNRDFKSYFIKSLQTLREALINA